MHRPVVVAAVALTVVAFSISGCINERTYIDEQSTGAEMGWDTWGGSGLAALRGDVGDLSGPDGIDNTSNNMWVTRDTTYVQMSGDVPHQARPGSSVYLDIVITNPNQMRVGEEVRQQGVVDDVYAADGPALDVYVCPNGEGISGNADDIVVTKTGRDTFTFEARSTDTAQNLDVNLDLTATE